jgi:hypothetical protein
MNATGFVSLQSGPRRNRPIIAVRGAVCNRREQPTKLRLVSRRYFHSSRAVRLRGSRVIAAGVSVFGG